MAEHLIGAMSSSQSNDDPEAQVMACWLVGVKPLAKQRFFVLKDAHCPLDRVEQIEILITQHIFFCMIMHVQMSKQKSKSNVQVPCSWSVEMSQYLNSFVFE